MIKKLKEAIKKSQLNAAFFVVVGLLIIGLLILFVDSAVDFMF